MKRIGGALPAVALSNFRVELKYRLIILEDLAVATGVAHEGVKNDKSRDGDAAVGEIQKTFTNAIEEHREQSPVMSQGHSQEGYSLNGL